jgi:hypothetical protein
MVTEIQKSRPQEVRMRYPIRAPRAVTKHAASPAPLSNTFPRRLVNLEDPLLEWQSLSAIARARTVIASAAVIRWKSYPQ